MPASPNSVLVTPPKKFYATRASGAELRRSVLANAAVDATVVIDFSSVESATGGFIDELVCGLAELRAVRVKGMNDTLAETVAQEVDRRGYASRVTGLRRPRRHTTRTTDEIDNDITLLTTQTRGDVGWYIALAQLWREMAAAAFQEKKPGWMIFAAGYVANDYDSRAREVQAEQEQG